MEIPAFAEITYRVLQKTPLVDFIPTLCLPEKRQILALEGVPEEKKDEIRRVTIEWAESQTALDEEFLVAFRDGDSHFRIVRRAGGKFTDALYPEKRA